MFMRLCVCLRPIPCAHHNRPTALLTCRRATPTCHVPPPERSTACCLGVAPLPHPALCFSLTLTLSLPPPLPTRSPTHSLCPWLTHPPSPTDLFTLSCVHVPLGARPAPCAGACSRRHRRRRLLQGSLSLPGSPFNLRRSSRGSHQLTWRAANGRKMGDRKPLVLSTYMDAQEHLPYADDSAAVTPMSEENGTMVLPLYQQPPSGLLAGSRHGSYTSHGSRRSYNSHGDLLNGRGLTKESQLRSRRAPPADAAEMQPDCVSTAADAAQHGQLSSRRAWARAMRPLSARLWRLSYELYRLSLSLSLYLYFALSLVLPLSCCRLRV